MTLDPRTPVLVGLGVATQRDDDPAQAADALGLMLRAVDQAGLDCGAPGLLRQVGQVSVPKGRWRYGNAAGVIARHIGVPDAETVGATVGVLQQTLIGLACRTVAEGTAEAALVAGGDAGYRILRGQITGQPAPDTEDTGTPDRLLAPAEELRHPAELRAGLRQAVGPYAMIESAYRARRGWSVAEHADRMARLYSRFTVLAAANPHAWKRDILPPERIRDPGKGNQVQASPYNKLHCSSWNVDQASALLVCSAAAAQAAGVPRERWVFPLAHAESNAMVPVSARAALSACPGAGIAGRAALGAAGLDAKALDLVELYSCFPAAVELYAEELGLPLERDLTVTGGMPFAGGPYNNYVLQATCRMAELLRARSGTGLVASVSGILTKQGMGVWSTEPGLGFRAMDVSAEVDAAIARKLVLDAFDGQAIVAGFTVLHARGQPPRAIALADTPDGGRVVAFSDDPAVADRFATAEMCGRTVQVFGTGLSL